MLGFPFHEFPYGDSHELNLDWIINTIKKLTGEVETFKVVNQIHFEGEWTIEKAYQRWSMVDVNGNGYISIKPVPIGVNIDNEDYWRLVANYSALYADFQNRVITLETEVDSIKDTFVTPEMFGAIGDGIADDTKAIKDAINSGKAVVLAAKKYRVIEDIQILSDMLISGSGKDSILYLDNCTFGADGSISNTPVYGFKISNLTFEVPDNYDGVAVKFYGDANYNDIYHFELDNVQIKHTSLNPQPKAVNHGTGILFGAAYSAVITNLTIHDFNIGLKVEQPTGRSTGVNTLVFVGGEIQSCNVGMELNGARNVTFDNMTTEGNNSYGCHITGSCDGLGFREIYTEGNVGCDFLIDKTVGTDTNKAISFDNCVGRAGSNTEHFIKLVSCVGISINNLAVRGGYNYSVSIIGNAAADAKDVQGYFGGVTDAFNNMYEVIPINDAITHPSSGVKVIDHETTFFHNNYRDFYHMNNTLVTNTAGSATELDSVTIPANNFGKYGGIWKYKATGVLVASADSKTISFALNGVTNKNFVISDTSDSPWVFEAEIIPHATANNQSEMILELKVGGETQLVEQSIVNSNTADLTITLSGTCASASIRKKASYLSVQR